MLRVSFTEMKIYARVLGAAGVTRPLNKIISKRHMAFMEHINSGGWNREISRVWEIIMHEQ